MATLIEAWPATPPSAHGTWARREGLPLPLGVTWIPEERAYNFAIYSKHADGVTLLAYRDDDLVHPVLSVALDHLHHPYASAVHFPEAFDRRAAIAPGSNAGRAPLDLLPHAVSGDDVEHSLNVGLRPARHESDAVIYELHVRNFTRHSSAGVSANKRGTFAGIIEKIPYLVDLGVTIVELMPVFQCDPAAPDHWGYMPLSFFALHHEYLSALDPGAGHHEFREMVDALHRAGIEVVLDVVYNHTCERGRTGPMYSYKGIDNSTYYLMTGESAEPATPISTS